MKASILLTLILFKSLLIDPTNAAALTGRHELDCVDNVLFNEQVMKTLLGMNEEDCLNGLPDPDVLFKHIKFSENPSDDFETRLLEIPLTLENLGIGATRSHSSYHSQDGFVDNPRNQALDEYQLDPNFGIINTQKISHLKEGINVDLGINESRVIEEQVEEVDVKSSLESSGLELSGLDDNFDEEMRQRQQKMNQMLKIDDFKRPEIHEDNLHIAIKDRSIIKESVQQDLGVEEPVDTVEEDQPDIKLSLKIDDEIPNVKNSELIEEVIEDDEEVEAPLIRSQKNIEEEEPFGEFQVPEFIEDQNNRPSLKITKPIESVKEEEEEYVAPFDELNTSDLVNENSRPVQTQPKTNEKKSNVHIAQPTVTLDVDHQQREEVQTEEVIDELTGSDDELDLELSDIKIDDKYLKNRFEAPVIETAKINIINDDRVMDIIYDPKNAKKNDPLTQSQPQADAVEIPADSIHHSNVQIEEPQITVSIDQTTQKEHEIVVEEEDIVSSEKSSELFLSDFANFDIQKPVIPVIHIEDEQKQIQRQEIDINIKDPIIAKNSINQSQAVEEVIPEIKKSEESLSVSEPVEQIQPSLEKSEIITPPIVQEESNNVHIEEPNVVVDIDQNRVEEIKTSEVLDMESSGLGDSLLDLNMSFGDLKRKKFEAIQIEDHRPAIQEDDITINIHHEFQPKISENEKPIDLSKSEPRMDEVEPAEIVPVIKKSSIANSDVQQPVVEEIEENPFEDMKVSDIAKDAISHKNPLQNLKVTELINEKDKPVIVAPVPPVEKEIKESDKSEDPVDNFNDSEIVDELKREPKVNPSTIKQSTDKLHVSQPEVVVDIDEVRKEEVKVSEQSDDLEESGLDLSGSFTFDNIKKSELKAPVIKDHQINIINNDIEMNIVDQTKPQPNISIKESEPVEEPISELNNSQPEVGPIKKTEVPEIEEPENFDFPFSDLNESEFEKVNKPDPKVKPTPVVTEDKPHIHVSDPIITVDIEPTKEQEIRVSEEESIKESEDLDLSFGIKISDKKRPIFNPIIDEPQKIDIQEDNLDMNIILDKPTNPINPIIKSSESSITSSEPIVKHSEPLIESSEPTIEPINKSSIKSSEPIAEPINKSSLKSSEPKVEFDMSETISVAEVKESEPINISESDDLDLSDSIDFTGLQPKKFDPIIIKSQPIKIQSDDLEINIADIKHDPKQSEESIDLSLSKTDPLPPQSVDPKIKVSIDVSKHSDVKESIRESSVPIDSSELDLDMSMSVIEPKKIVPVIIKSEKPIIESEDIELNIINPAKTEEVIDDIPKINIIPASDRDSEIDEEIPAKTEVVIPKIDPKIHHSEPDIVVDINKSGKTSIKESIDSNKSSELDLSSDIIIDPKNLPKGSIKDSIIPSIHEDDIIINPRLNKTEEKPTPPSKLSVSDDSIRSSLTNNADSVPSIPSSVITLKPSELIESQEIKSTPIIKSDIPHIKKSSEKPSIIEPDKPFNKNSEEPKKSESSDKSSKKSEGFNSKSFTYINEPSIEINHFGKSDKGKGGYGKTRIVVQTVAQRVMPTSIAQTKATVANEIFRAFPLLHKCVQSALLFCNPNFEKLKSACEASSGRECEINDFSAKIKCAADEDLISNACYKKCPEGFKNYKFFCLKPTAVKRSTHAFQGEHLNDNEELYGDNLVVEKCAKYGKYMADFGPDYCKARCPMDFKDRGLFCQKPARFQKQQVYVFSRQTAIRSE